jgi:hypothetical protein
MEEWGKLIPTYFTAWHLKAGFHLCAVTCKDAPHCKDTRSMMHNHRVLAIKRQVVSFKDFVPCMN